jgi:TatD DNase family protein
MGLHPTSVKENYREELEHVKHWLDNFSFYGVGEIGIDLFWDKKYLQFQQDAFKKQIEWAKILELPIIIHCRDAFNEIFEVLDEVKDENLKGIFHCFTGNMKQAERAINFNMKLGIGGVVTFKNGGIDKILHKISLNHLVLETDSPYLAPVPFRGKRNESSYIINVLDKLAVIYNLPSQKIAHITTQNSIEVFGI